MRIILTDGQGPTGAIIRWWTWSWAAHAGVMTDTGLVLDATPSRGVSVHEGIAGKQKKYYDVLCPEHIKHNAQVWLAQQLGTPYDWSAILGMGFRRDWHKEGSWFCSELVAAAFEYAGFNLLRSSHLNRVTPRDLLLSPYLVEVEG